MRNAEKYVQKSMFFLPQISLEPDFIWYPLDSKYHALDGRSP